jgi:hypothetical protein
VNARPSIQLGNGGSRRRGRWGSCRSAHEGATRALIRALPHNGLLSTRPLTCLSRPVCCTRFLASVLSPMIASAAMSAELGVRDRQRIAVAAGAALMYAAAAFESPGPGVPSVETRSARHHPRTDTARQAGNGHPMRVARRLTAPNAGHALLP